MSDVERTILARDALRPFRLERGALLLLDQRALPHDEKWLALRTVEEIAQAIETLAVRGAPAIGGCAALALAHVARTSTAGSGGALLDELRTAEQRLRKTRPTAVNLFFALDAVMRAAHDARAGASEVGAASERSGLALQAPPARSGGAGAGRTPGTGAGARDAKVDIVRAVVDAAEQLVHDDEAACARMGEHGASLFRDGDVVMTVCHTGALATCGQGTALGVIKSARAQGKDVKVVALETRPLLQGARLTAWECMREGIPCTLVTDGMAAFAMKRLGVTKAIVGADRIARDGSTANKIGTYALAVSAKHHGVPFYVAAPSSTIDAKTATGDAIPIEERAPDEVRDARGTPLAPRDVRVWNPAFDVTPPALVTAFVTERGVLQPPFLEEAR